MAVSEGGIGYPGSDDSKVSGGESGYKIPESCFSSHEAAQGVEGASTLRVNALSRDA